MTAGAGARLLRSLGLSILGLCWIGVGLLVGWFVGDLADHLVLTQHHLLIYFGLGLSAVVLVGWAYGTRLIYLDVRAGLDEASGEEPTRRRSGYAWTAALAGPVVGLLLSLSSPALPHAGAGAAPAPASGIAAPAAAPRGPATPTAAAATPRYVTRPGDTITTLAEQAYGSPLDWPRITAANPSRTGAGTRMSDPSLLHAGTTIELPGAARSPQGSTRNRAGSGAASRPGNRPAGQSASGSLRAVELYAALSGLGLLGCAILARRLRRLRRLQQMRGQPGGSPPRLSDADAAIEAELRPLELAELPDFIDGANRLLCAGLLADPGIEAPRVSLVRAGPRGIELLLDEALSEAPPGFVLESEGRCLRLDPSLDLDELRAGAGEAQPYLAVLIPVAEDDDGSYLVACGPGESVAFRGTDDEMERALGAVWAHAKAAPWGEVELYRVGEASFVGSEEMLELSVDVVAGLAEASRRDPLWRAGLPESQPVVIVADPETAGEVRARAPGIVAVIGTMLDADRVVVYEGPTLSIEPLGITLPAVLPTRSELAAVLRLSAAASQAPLPPVTAADEVLPDPASELPAAGPVELRLLRPVPDLVGDVADNVAPEVVQVTAYLALHSYRATTEQLRDVLGNYQRDVSRAAKTVHNAVSKVRAALGPERFPHAVGGRPYGLDCSVSCDWLRFIEIAAIGRSLERAGRPREAIEALRQALELISDDGPPCSDRSVIGRYSFLDAEQFLVELETAVVHAAHQMALLAITHRPSPSSLADAAWAIRKGRVVAPESEPLCEAALRLAAASDDEDGIESEFYKAVDAVDELGLGEEVDPRIESLYNGLSTKGPPARLPRRTPYR